MSSAHPNLLIWTVIAAYLVLVTAAGGYYSKFMKTSADYFKAGNAIPWWASGISMYMSNFTAYTFVGIGSLVYIEGLSGLLLETGPALAYLLAALFCARRWHRLNLMAPPEYLEIRFNPTTRKVFSLFGISTTFFSSGIRLFAMCKFAEGTMGVPLIPAIMLTGSVIVIYTMMGGLWAVIVTDFVQFVVLMVAATCLLLTCAWVVFADVGLAEFISRIPADYGTFPGANPEHAWGWLLTFWLSYLLDYNGDWGVIQRMCCTPTERDAKKSALLAMGFAIPHAFFLLGPCFIARVLYSQQLGSPTDPVAAERAYAGMAALVLPPGLVGVVLAAMFSATMSTLSTAWNVRSASFVSDLYVRFIRPLAGDREQILMGRVAIALLGGIGVGVAILVSRYPAGVFRLSQYLVALIVVPILSPFLIALFVSHTKRWAALAAMAGCLAFAVLNKWGFILMGRTAPLPFEAEIPIQFTLSVVILWIASRLPQNEMERQQQAEFDRRIAHARPTPPVVASDVPPPLGVMGSFVLVIGFLLLALACIPQTLVHRGVTLTAALLLLAVGTTMRRVNARLAALIPVVRP